MPFVILISCIVLLLVLVSVLDISPFLALVFTAFFAGICQKMDAMAVLKSMQTGIGSTLSSIALILAFGVMLGQLLSESGAAQKISSSMISWFGVKRVKLAIVLTGFMVGIAMFYNAGFLILIPLVFTIAVQTGLSPVYCGIAMASSLSVTHGFLPPHPGPTAIANLFGANMGKTLIYGLIVAFPASIFAGLIFPEFVKKIISKPSEKLFNAQLKAEAELPSLGVSLLMALSPVVLMAIATINELVGEKSSGGILHFLGEPSVSILLALIIGVLYLKLAKGKSVKSIMENLHQALSGAALLLLIIAGGGAFKQVLMDGGMGNQIAAYFADTQFSPLFIGWLLATIIRISLGSATVAGITAGGIVAPMIAKTGASPELMVIAIGAGSMMCSHVNDSGFWMFKEFFGLSVKDTFKTWTVLETIVGVTGLIGVLTLNLFV